MVSFDKYLFGLCNKLILFSTTIESSAGTHTHFEQRIICTALSSKQIRQLILVLKIYYLIFYDAISFSWVSFGQKLVSHTHKQHC